MSLTLETSKHFHFTISTSVHRCNDVENKECFWFELGILRLYGYNVMSRRGSRGIFNTSQGKEKV